MTDSNGFWIGAVGSYDNSQIDNGADPPTYRWSSTDHTITPSFWGNGQPDVPGIACVRLRSKTNGDPWVLGDVDCANNYGVICEAPAAPTLATVSVGVAPHNKYTRTVPPATWPLCHGETLSRRVTSRVQCATWCSADVTCVGFEFDGGNNTCQLVTLTYPCVVTSSQVSTSGGYFHNVEVDVELLVAQWMMC